MRASQKKKRDFHSKLAEGRKLSNPGETQWQREIKTVRAEGWGVGVRPEQKAEEKGKEGDIR